jgi:hypothetical protein
MKLIECFLISTAKIKMLLNGIKIANFKRYFYTQGQYFNDKRIREYFYFVNDHGEVNKRYFFKFKTKIQFSNSSF